MTGRLTPNTSARNGSVLVETRQPHEQLVTEQRNREKRTHVRRTLEQTFGMRRTRVRTMHSRTHVRKLSNKLEMELVMEMELGLKLVDVP
jgi:hypothetical protein